MLMLTVIVVTKGRKEYLPALLASLAGQLDAHTSAYVIDNGSTDGSADIIQQWCQRTGDRTEFTRVEENTHDFRRWLDLAKARFGSTWVTFPGDDDILLPGHLSDFQMAFEQSPQIAIVAAGCQDMHADGTMLGSAQIPDSNVLGSRPSLIGRLLAGPQFPWPSIAFRASAIEGSMPTYRFVFDWWVQLNCLLDGDYATTGRASVAYRRHPAQEGHMWSTRRKYAEASWMLHDLLLSDRFAKFAATLTPAEREETLDALTQAGGAVYGDPIFGLPVSMAAVHALAPHHLPTPGSLGLAGQASASLELSPAHATLLTWLGAQGGSEPPHQRPASLPSVDVSAATDLCPRSIQALSTAHLRHAAGARIRIVCSHHPHGKSNAATSVLIPCQASNDDAELAHALRDRVEAVLEDQASLTSGLQPMERRLLQTYRSAVERMPRRVKAALRRGNS